MTHAATLLFALAAPLLIGVPALALLGLPWRRDRLGRTASAWLLGCLGLGAMVQLGIECGLPRSWWWGLPIAPAAPLVVLARRRSAARDTEEPAAADLPFTIFVVAGVLVGLWFALAGMDRPCVEGDEGNIWSLKAKSLLVDFPEPFATTQVFNLHPDYPQLDPLLQSWVYALTGVPDFVQFENRWPVQLCCLALFVATASALRHRLPTLVAAPLASLILLEPEYQSLCRTAYADGMVALGLTVALDSFLRWRDGGERGQVWLSGLALAFSLWSKNESMLYLASAAIAAVLVRSWAHPLRGGWSPRNLVVLLPAAAVVAYTALWNRRFGMRSDLLGANPTGKTMFELMAEQWRDRVPAMLAEAWSSTLALGHVHAVFAALLLAVALLPRVALGRRFALPVLAVSGGLAGLHIVYVGSFLPLRFHLDTSYLRVLFQILPVTLVLLGAVLSAVVVEARTRQTPAPA
ncbi:MAG: hypothetical protein KDC98_19235 [Planctomycetes bacterium]|nr:hypothetical protein [Planctomycetota bacterium]